MKERKQPATSNRIQQPKMKELWDNKEDEAWNKKHCLPPQ